MPNIDRPVPPGPHHQNRKPKVYCPTCKKSQWMHWVPGGFDCPKCHTLVKRKAPVAAVLHKEGA